MFPRDRVLLAPQARLTVLDEALAWMGAISGLSLEWLFFLGYLLTAALFAAGVALIGSRLYVSRWSTAALLMALTLRHRIARTGVNTYESGFHPRVLTFAIGLVAAGLYLRGRRALAVALALLRVPGAPDNRRVVRDLDDRRRGGRGVAVARGPARGRRRRAAREPSWASAVIASGALAERLAVMDAAWLAAFESRDYLFPSDDWKIGTWLTHLLPSVVIVAVWQWRRRLGVTTPHEHGGRSLGASRCWSCSWRPCRSSTRASRWPSSCRPRACSGSSSCWRRRTSCGRLPKRRGHRFRPRPARRGRSRRCSRRIGAARGYYILRVEHDNRLVAVHLPASDWQRMGAWIASNTAPQAHVLADPEHVWSAGGSLRVIARRDVLLEGVKDAAIAIYSRDSALQVTERRRAIGDFNALTEARADSAGRHLCARLPAHGTVPAVAARAHRGPAQALSASDRVE